MKPRRKAPQKKDRGLQDKKRPGDTKGLLAMVLVFLGGLGSLIFRERRRKPGYRVKEVEPNRTRREGVRAAEASYFNKLTLRLAGSGLFYALALVAGVAVVLLVYFMTIGGPPEAGLPLPRQLILDVRPRVAELEGIRRELVEEQKQRLESYGWIDRDNGQAHLPIERAMQILVEERGP
jgi:hypothetical protein